MTRQRDDAPVLFRLQELCERLGVVYRDARYVCERGWLPAGVDRQPGRGNHRLLTPAQAVWLGIVLRLKACGVPPRAAATIASFAAPVKGGSQNPRGRRRVLPWDGAFQTDCRWFIEVGDMLFIRVVTGATLPTEETEEVPWLAIDSGQPAPEASPIVSLRIDVSALTRLLRGLPGG